MGYFIGGANNLVFCKMIGSFPNSGVIDWLGVGPWVANADRWHIWSTVDVHILQLWYGVGISTDKIVINIHIEQWHHCIHCHCGSTGSLSSGKLVINIHSQHQQLSSLLSKRGGTRKKKQVTHTGQPIKRINKQIKRKMKT